MWNERTGHLVGGHQRLAVLDEDAKGEDYSLDVAVVDLDEAAERALNVRLNNPTMMGEFDFGLLEQLVRDAAVPIDLQALGFDDLDLKVLFPEEAQKATSPAVTGSEKPPSLFDPRAERNTQPVEELKSYKKKTRERGKDEDSAEFWVALVFGDRAEVDRFLAACRLAADERFHDGRRFCTNLGIDLDTVIPD